MPLLSSDNLLSHITNIIHEETQLHSDHLDLTVDSVYRFTKAGSLDFGGSEFAAAGSQQINPAKEHPDDDYGWWKLNAGCYVATFNEQLTTSEGMLGIITPHIHARQAGLICNTSFIASVETVRLVFNVPECGCRIKENARLASVYILER